MNNLILQATDNTNQGSGTKEQLMKILKSPVLYIVLGAIVLLIIVFYLIRRFIKAKPNAVTIVVRKGQIHKVVDDKNPKYFLVPFADKVGAIISLNERELNSDKLFINNGPDALYKVNYTLKYKVTNPVEFYKYVNNFQDLIIKKLNDDLREYADQGNALVLVKDYRANNELILSLINKAIEEYQVEALSFKINLIEPMGRQ